MGNYAYNVEGNIFRLKNCELFDGLKKPDIYEKGRIIFQQGDDDDYVYYLKKGKVQIYICSPNGTEKTLTVFSSGNLFGKSSFFDKTQRNSCAKALTRSEVINIDKTMMMDMISKNPQFALDMLTYMAKTIRMFTNQIENISFLQADKRIARFIADNFNDGSKNIICTHEEISNIIGASRITVSKILSRFVQYGWIETKYKAITVKDIKKLTNFAYD